MLMAQPFRKRLPPNRAMRAGKEVPPTNGLLRWLIRWPGR
jgi:hypothetical protein